MACFTLTGEQRSILAKKLSIACDAAIQDDDVSVRNFSAILCFVEEIEASRDPIEITVTAIEPEENLDTMLAELRKANGVRHIDMDDAIAMAEDVAAQEAFDNR